MHFTCGSLASSNLSALLPQACLQRIRVYSGISKIVLKVIEEESIKHMGKNPLCTLPPPPPLNNYYGIARVVVYNHTNYFHVHLH